MSDNASSILASLEPMFKEAEDRKLWFHSSYQDIWLSPKELREQHAQGRLIWGPVNWRLRDPQEYLKQLHGKIVATEREIANFKERMK